jgi:hypothetical protein
MESVIIFTGQWFPRKSRENGRTLLHSSDHSADPVGPHCLPSPCFTVPMLFASSSQYFARVISLLESPRGLWVVHCTVRDPNFCKMSARNPRDPVNQYSLISSWDGGSSPCIWLQLVGENPAWLAIQQQSGRFAYGYFRVSFEVVRLLNLNSRLVQTPTVFN